MSEKEKIQYGRHHNLDNLKTVIFIELIQINACVIHVFILASNDTTNECITDAESLKFRKMAAIFNRRNAKSYNSLCCN